MLRVASCRATHRQTSPGKNSHLPAYARRIYFRAFRAGTGLRVFCAPSSNAAASYAVSCSSGQRFVSGFLQIPPRDGHPCLQLTVPPAGPVEDLACSAHAAPPGESPCRAQQRKRGRSRLEASPSTNLLWLVLTATQHHPSKKGATRGSAGGKRSNPYCPHRSLTAPMFSSAC